MPIYTTAQVNRAGVEITRGSSVEAQLLVSVGDPNSSDASAAVLNSRAASTAWGLVTRSIVPDSTTASGVSSASGDLTVLSSATGQSIYVYAYALGSVSSGLNIVRWLSGSTSELWRTPMAAAQGAGAGSTGGPAVLGMMSVTPPAYLFRTGVAAALVVSRGSTAHLHYSVAAWRE